MTLSWSVFKTFIVKTQYFVEQAPGAQGIAQVYKTPICLAPASFPPLVVTCLWLILDCSQIVPLVNNANKRHSLALLISPVCPHCLLNNRSYFLQMTTYVFTQLMRMTEGYQNLGMSYLSFQPSFSFCAIPASLEAKQVDNVQKSRPSHKFWIGNLWLGSRQPVQLLI